VTCFILVFTTVWTHSKRYAMKRIRIDARQSDLEHLQNVIYYFEGDRSLNVSQLDALEALKIAISDALKRRIEHQTETINYYDNRKNK